MNPNSQEVYAKFLIIKEPEGGLYNYQFMDGSEVLLLGTGFKVKELCLMEIESVKNSAPFRTRYEKRNGLMNHKFNLRSRNGLVIGSSKTYFSSFKMENALYTVKQTASLAPIEDITELSATSIANNG